MSLLISNIDWLQSWYARHCDGDWEHDFENVRIGTLDNPGWSVDINLIGTECENLSFTKLVDERSDENWVHCWIDSGKFHGRGGITNLNELIEVFRNWAEKKDCG